jgi:hypothetical protein
MKTSKTLSALVFVLTLSILAVGEGTKTWQQSSYDEFSRGTTKGIAINSQGILELAPAFQSIHTSPATYIWSIASDQAGNVFVGTGSPARVYRITPDGKATVIFEPKELQVQSVAVDKSGAIYAATSPDGMVYKIERSSKKEGAKKDEPSSKKSDSEKDSALKDSKLKDSKLKDSKEEAASVPVDPDYSASVFFEPKTKYIWNLSFDPEGRLFVATGDRGEIFRVSKDGSSSLFFKSDEAHIRSLIFHPNGDLIAGSDGSGLIYRISPVGEGFVIFSAAKKEITALALDNAGNIYAAGVGEKKSGTTQTGVPFNLIPPPPALTAQAATPAPMFFPSFNATGGSEVYMISPDGSPKRLWSGRDDIIYALAFDARGRLLAGSGNKGRLLAIAKNGEYSDLLKASANQITAFAPAPSSGLYVATSNLGKIFLMGAASTEEGVLESEVYDARIFSKWGRAEVQGSGTFDLFSRSGNVDNPDRNWSPWKKVSLAQDSSIEAPAARFIQWKIVIPARSSARVNSVKLNFRPKNVAPVIDDITVQSGARFNNIPGTSTRIGSGTPDTIMVGFGSQPPTPGLLSAPRIDSPIAAQRDRGSIAVRWSARDDNDDTLLYSIYYRGDGESKWKLLKDKISEKLYSWDSGLLPDGGYTIRVVASDAPSQSPDEALTDVRESQRFEVDNSAPRIDGLTAKLHDGALRISFTATDTFSPIQRAEFSLDAGEWQFVEPVGQLSDAKLENYDFSARPLLQDAAAPTPSSVSEKKKSAKTMTTEKTRAGDSSDETPNLSDLSNEHVVVVRVYDRFDNVSTAKIVVK